MVNISAHANPNINNTIDPLKCIIFKNTPNIIETKPPIYKATNLFFILCFIRFETSKSEIYSKLIVNRIKLGICLFKFGKTI